MSTSFRKSQWAPRDAELLARRHEEILSAAARFFAEEGYQNADLQVLADQLGVGKGTVYRYFPSKEELFLAATDRAMHLLHDYVEQRCSQVDDPLERIACAIKSFFSFFDANPEFVELLMQERAEFRNRKQPTYSKYREAHVGPWEELMQKLIHEERLRPIMVQRIGEKISNLLYGTLFTNYYLQHNEGFEQQTKDILEVIFLGILSDKERAQFSRTATSPS